MRRKIYTLIGVIAMVLFVVSVKAQSLQVTEKVKETSQQEVDVNRKVMLPPVEDIFMPEPIPISAEETTSEGGKWYGDVIIRSGSYHHPEIARLPGSSATLFTVFGSGSYVYLYKSTNSGNSWDYLAGWSVSSWVNEPCPNIAVTNDYVFVVYESNGNVYVRKYNLSGSLINTYVVANTGNFEGHPAIATDAEKFSTSEWLYVVWEYDGTGQDVYYRIWNEDWTPMSSEIGIFGAGTANDYTYPDICYDNSGSNRVHVVAWQSSENKIAYRGATSFGDDPSEWESSFYFPGPPSGYLYRLAHIDAQGERVLATWERCKSDYTEVHAYFSYSTNGGIYSSNFSTRYFTAEKWRPVPVLANTSSRWYIIVWVESGSNTYYVKDLYSTNPSSSWYIDYVSDNLYSSLPWFSFGGTTFGDGYLNVVWADNATHVAFDGEYRSGIEEEYVDKSTMLQCFPNPFVINTAILYKIPQRAYVTLKIYDCAGKEVKTLIDRNINAGSYTVQWDARDNAGNRLPSGIYFCRLEAGEFTATHKMTIVK